jgi:hypothetical protein
MESNRHLKLNTHRIASVIMLIIIFTSYCVEANGQESVITHTNPQFIYYPDFPEGQSTWDDIGYDARFNTVYAVVTNHHNKLGLYESWYGFKV